MKHRHEAFQQSFRPSVFYQSRASRPPGAPPILARHTHTPSLERRVPSFDRRSVFRSRRRRSRGGFPSFCVRSFSARAHRSDDAGRDVTGLTTAIRANARCSSSSRPGRRREDRWRTNNIRFFHRRCWCNCGVHTPRLGKAGQNTHSTCRDRRVKTARAGRARVKTARAGKACENSTCVVTTGRSSSSRGRGRRS